MEHIPKYNVFSDKHSQSNIRKKFKTHDSEINPERIMQLILCGIASLCVKYDIFPLRLSIRSSEATEKEQRSKRTIRRS